MKILVVEDKQMHQESAQKTLVGHDLTVVGSLDAAMRLLADQTDEVKLTELLEAEGFKATLDPGERRARDYWDAKDRLRPQCIIPVAFDAVLTDMMMPMSRETLAPGIFNSAEQVPYGLIIALRAALCAVKFIAMLTDSNHHKSAMSAALDHLGPAYFREEFRPNFNINGGRAMFIHTPFLEEVLGKITCTTCSGTGPCPYCQGTLQRTYHDESVGTCNGCTDNPGKCRDCSGSGQADDFRNDRKDWGKVLAILTVE